MVVLKEEEKRETEIVKGSLVGASFNPDQDKDKDGINDFIEIAKYGLDAEVKQSKVQLEREQFEHKKIQDQEDNKLKKEKMSIERKKLNKTNSQK